MTTRVLPDPSINEDIAFALAPSCDKDDIERLSAPRAEEPDGGSSLAPIDKGIEDDDPAPDAPDAATPEEPTKPGNPSKPGKDKSDHVARPAAKSGDSNGCSISSEGSNRASLPESLPIWVALGLALTARRRRDAEAV